MKNKKALARPSIFTRSRASIVGVFTSIVMLLACSPSLTAKDISQEEFLAMDETARVLLDVRTVEEYTAGHIPTSINVPVDEIESKLNSLSGFKDKPIVVYCRSGRRAGKAMSILQEKGFTNLLHLEGDMNGWQAAKRTTVQAPSQN